MPSMRPILFIDYFIMVFIVFFHVLHGFTNLIKLVIVFINVFRRIAANPI